MYEIVGWSDAHPSVEIWSSTRLPFEPKGEMLQLRTEIRAAVRQVVVADGQLLRAIYQSGQTDVVDLDNVLFDNVGYAAFAECGARGLVFERSFGALQPAPTGSRYSHYSKYEAAPTSGQAGRNRRAVLRFAAATLPSLGDLSNVWELWSAVRRGDVEILEKGTRLPNSFGVDVVIEGGRRAAHPVRVLKYVLDGVIAGFHSHDGSAMDAVLAPVAASCHLGLAETRRLLLDSSVDVLGTRRLVWVRGDGVQINPADDRLSFAHVTSRSSSEPRIRIRGELFAMNG